MNNSIKLGPDDSAEPFQDLEDDLVDYYSEDDEEFYDEDEDDLYDEDEDEDEEE